MNTNQEDSERLGHIQHCTTQNRLTCQGGGVSQWPNTQQLNIQVWNYLYNLLYRLKRAQPVLHIRKTRQSGMLKIEHFITVTVTAVHWNWENHNTRFKSRHSKTLASIRKTSDKWFSFSKDLINGLKWHSHIQKTFLHSKLPKMHCDVSQRTSYHC